MAVIPHRVSYLPFDRFPSGIASTMDLVRVELPGSGSVASAAKTLSDPSLALELRGSCVVSFPSGVICFSSSAAEIFLQWLEVNV